VNIDDVVGNNQTTNLWYGMLSTRICLYYFISDLLPKHRLPKSLRIGSVRNIQWLQPSKAMDILQSVTIGSACPFGYQLRWDVISTRPFANYYLRLLLP